MRPRIHTFIATSKIHMEDKLKKTPDEVVQIAVDAVTYARSLGCADVEFSPEDAGRSEPAFLHRILTAVVEAGATTLNIPDTVGICLPEEFGALIAGIKANVPGDYVISTHCQNDLGLSTANSLAGVANGARQVECTVNGIGERAGNASLEEVAMAIWMRGAEKKLFGRAPESTRCTSTVLQDSEGFPVCRATRQGDWRQRSRTSPAFTRMACSRTRRRTRSSPPRRSVTFAARTTWAW